MKPVYLMSEVHATTGSLGYSCLVEPIFPGDAPKRKTMLFLRDGDGRFQNCIILDAAVVRDRIY